MTDARPDQNWRTRDIDQKLGARVEQLCAERGFSQSDLARRLGVSDGALQHIREGRVRMTASQLWQICGVTGVEIADVFVGLPNHIYKTRADYERLQDLRNHASAISDAQEMMPDAGQSPGVGETFWGLAPEAAPRADLANLAKAARKLTPEDVAYLIRTAKGLRR